MPHSLISTSHYLLTLRLRRFCNLSDLHLWRRLCLRDNLAILRDLASLRLTLNQRRSILSVLVRHDGLTSFHVMGECANIYPSRVWLLATGAATNSLNHRCFWSAFCFINRNELSGFSIATNFYLARLTASS